MFKALKFLISSLLLFSIAGTGGGLYILLKYGQDLPDHQQLAEYRPPMVTRLHAGDGRLLAEYAIEKRVFVPISAIPKNVIKAFIATEDQNFFSHPGLDLQGIIRAALTNLRNYGTGRRLEGASTITQQVAKNFLLTNERSLARKIREAILALRIDQAFSKEHILELYLNEIYLGMGSYGVAAAAMNYFNKSLDELTIAEAAYLAVLPKAPNNYDPIYHADAAVRRRNWVIGRMLAEGYLSEMQAANARAEPFRAQGWDKSTPVRADFFAEEVRRRVIEKYDDETLYKGGLYVHTTLDPRIQEAADKALRNGLIAYDRRHGWRGALQQIDPKDWERQLQAIPQPPGAGSWQLAVVLEVDRKVAKIGVVERKPVTEPALELAADLGIRPSAVFEGGEKVQGDDKGSEGVFKDRAPVARKGRIPFANMKWARKNLPNQRIGRRPRRPSDVVQVGDVVLVEAETLPDDQADLPADEAAEGVYALVQIPEISGGIVAMDPHTGRVLAMTGGYSYEMSQFNRATQAWRQPGSAFKPFVYIAAMDHGFTPASPVRDGPIVLDQGRGLPKWKPANYERKLFGLVPLRVGIERSLNLMTVRVAQSVGIDVVRDYALNFRVYDKMPELYSYALGSGETTLLRLTTAYGMLANGGKRIEPSFIDRIQDRHGRVIYRHDRRVCDNCNGSWNRQRPPAIPDRREQVADPASIYQVVNMMRDVVRRGTAARLGRLRLPLAGKTGTTNKSFDAWFVGFTPDLVCGVFVGFDTPRTLGRRATGGSVAVPIFGEFMKAAVDKTVPFRTPKGLRLMDVTYEFGFDQDEQVRIRVPEETFKPGTEPASRRVVIREKTSNVIFGSDGGLY